MGPLTKSAGVRRRDDSQLRADNDRLQDENDALRAIIESGRDLDAEVVAGVQAGQTARKPGP